MGEWDILWFNSPRKNRNLAETIIMDRILYKYVKNTKQENDAGRFDNGLIILLKPT